MTEYRVEFFNTAPPTLRLAQFGASPTGQRYRSLKHCSLKMGTLTGGFSRSICKHARMIFWRRHPRVFLLNPISVYLRRLAKHPDLSRIQSGGQFEYHRLWRSKNLKKSISE
jgi:hypothetical protein